ncbi:MAG: hypothetical protein HZA91_19810 [Verrucomicrobia bacterium]|nr:hypothetical protein [Verrucomicrobiota bacterium]
MRLVIVFCVMLAAVAAHAGNWQQKAMEMYPQLGVLGSPLNKQFWAAYQDRQKADPAFFNDPKWPVYLAKHCAEQMAAAAAPKPAPAAPTLTSVSLAAAPEAAELAASEKLFEAKCGKCHPPPDAAMEEPAWNRAMQKWKDKAGLDLDEFVRLMRYAKTVREGNAGGTKEPMDPDRKLLVAKCGRCHEAPNPAAEEMTWNRWLWKWKDRAQLTNDEYDQLMAYARRTREARQAKVAR